VGLDVRGGKLAEAKSELFQSFADVLLEAADYDLMQPRSLKMVSMKTQLIGFESQHQMWKNG